MRRILMCPPDYYGIEYEINPWMSRSRPADQRVAQRQWEKLVDLLRDALGLEIDLLTPVRGLPDLVFTANAGIVHRGIFIPSRFRPRERRGETPVHLAWFKKSGFRIEPLPGKLPFEGEGDFLRWRNEWFAGSGFRTEIRTHERVGKIVGRPVLSVELADPRFYHLDTCFCPLGDDSAIWYPPAFDAWSRQLIEAHIPRLIEASPEEALRFACNAVIEGKKVMLNTGCGKLRAELERAGYATWETDLSEFIKAGGAAKCLVLFLG